MPGRSTAGATRTSAAGLSGSARSNISGCGASSGGRNASEIRGHVALFAAQARPERGVDHRFDGVQIGQGRLHQPARGECGRSMTSEVGLKTRSDGPRRGVSGFRHAEADQLD